MSSNWWLDNENVVHYGVLFFWERNNKQRNHEFCRQTDGLEKIILRSPRLIRTDVSHPFLLEAPTDVSSWPGVTASIRKVKRDHCCQGRGWRTEKKIAGYKWISSSLIRSSSGPALLIIRHSSMLTAPEALFFHRGWGLCLGIGL